MVTVADLQRQRLARARVNHDTYKQLWRQVQHRIQTCASNRGTEMTWQVPPFVIGRPVYTVSHAARYVADKLRFGGFDVSEEAPQDDVRILHVTWKHAWRRMSRKRCQARRRPEASPTPRRTGVKTGVPGVTVDLVETDRALEKLKARLRIGH